MISQANPDCREPTLQVRVHARGRPRTSLGRVETNNVLTSSGDVDGMETKMEWKSEIDSSVCVCVMYVMYYVYYSKYNL